MPGGAGTVRWVLTDPVTLEEYEFDINPNEGGTPQLAKNVRYLNTSAPNGRVIAFEGRDDPKEMQVSGTILTQAHLEALQTWYAKRYQISLTDDLGRVYSIYITNFSAQRKRSALHIWKHTYNLSYVIIDWAT